MRGPQIGTEVTNARTWGHFEDTLLFTACSTMEIRSGTLKLSTNLVLPQKFIGNF